MNQNENLYTWSNLAQRFQFFVGLAQQRKVPLGVFPQPEEVLYGSGISDGNKHNHDPLPVLSAGGASGQVTGGRHLRYAKHTTMVEPSRGDPQQTWSGITVIRR